MKEIVDPAVEAYAEAHTTPPVALLAALAEETERTLEAPQMMGVRLRRSDAPGDR